MTDPSPTILLVDDTSANLGVLAEMLEVSGYQTRVAEDGASALEQMEFGLPDLVLLDVMMPGIDGFETCRRLKKDNRFSSTPVIFMTALAETGYKVLGFEVGAVDYITKPFQHEEVLARVRTHLEIVRLRKNLEQQSALKDRFMQIAAHDLRNPLASIQLAGDLLLDMLGDSSSPEEMIPIAAGIAKASRRMNEMIGSFLDYRKAAANRLDVQITTLDLPALLASVTDNHQSLADKKKIALETSIPDNLPLCSGDENRSHQIITNLVSNAVKYTPTRGRVSLSLLPENHHLKLVVADTGPGIPENERSKLFTEFASISTSPTGGEQSTGIGLWIVRKMAQAQGGECGADFPPSGGSAFWATWPLSLPAAQT